MSESMQGMSRSHMCAQVDDTLIGQQVTVMGWVQRKRNLGQLLFVALRDRTGIVQAVIDGSAASPTLFEKGEQLHNEYVVAIQGQVVARTAENINPDMKTGSIEIAVEQLNILSESQTPPFPVEDDLGVKDDLRLQYRYIDLRRPSLFRNIQMRHNTAQCARQFLNQEGFLEIETPILTRSTPEGARDYLVPSRIHPGSFYALPQSPQLFKQLLMVSGMDRYYQMARCFRDEDLRADRQPEFTQIDMELSFVDANDVMSINERLIQKVFREVLGVEVPVPFQRMPYQQAMDRFGSDKPDVRFGLELTDLSAVVSSCEFVVFQTALQAGGSVRGINAKGCATFSRKQVDALAEFVKTYGAKGLSWIFVQPDGTLKTQIAKFFTAEELQAIVEAMEGEPGDLLLICANEEQSVVYNALGALRLEIAKRLELTKPDQYSFLWVTEFPLLEWDGEQNRFTAMHHPFTSPMEEDLQLLETDPGKVRAKAYDMVLNGVELGGGSIRIHQAEVQQKMFQLLGFSEEEAYARFGFLLQAFQFGVPPHGGLAFGLDRMIMLMTGASSIRDVIAFPKVKDASCPMTDAPNVVEPKQLDELCIKKMEPDPERQ